MSKQSILMIALAAFCLTSWKCAFAQLPELDTAYPHRAPHVAPGEDLQKALEKHRVVRLSAGVYRGTITLRSDRRLYGVPGTRVHHIVVEPGTEKAVLWKVDTNLKFPPGRKATKHNIFTSIGSIEIQNAALEGNMFLDSGGITIDLSKSGYLRNNRFIRTVLQGPRQLLFTGNSSTPSYNNVFLWFNPLSPKSAPVLLSELQDITFIGVDAESWLFGNKGEVKHAMMRTGKMGTLRVFGGQGGNNNRREFRTPVLDSKAEEVQLYRFTPHSVMDSPNFILREGNKRLFMVGCSKYNRVMPKSNEFEFNAFEGRASGNDTIRHRGVTKKSLKALLIPRKRKGVPWETPDYCDIPNPAGKSWQKKLAKAPDHTAMLQKRIDKEGIVILAPGKYYISETLRIDQSHSIIGAGMDKTVIIAKNPDMSMFRPKPNSHSVTLANLTLQGGGIGLEVLAEDMKPHITTSYLSHLQFREMSKAAIHFNLEKAAYTSGGIDNNLFMRCIFYRCPSGVKQNPTRVRGSHAGYLDKNLFLECQFIECDYGLELMARRQNNLNSCISCLFRGCRTNAVKMRNSATTTFANCDFIDNGGNPVIQSNKSVVVVSCRFKAGMRARSLLPAAGSIEGCTFEAAGAIECDIVNGSWAHHFYNCRSDMPVGPLYSGMLVNNDFAADKAYSQLAVVVYQNGAQTVIPGETSPSPQMLFGANLGGKKRRKKKESAVRRPSADAVAKFDTLLRERLSATLASGDKVTFTRQRKKKQAQVIVNAISEDGKLQVTFAKSQKTAAVAIKRLSYADRLSLARAILQKDDPESHSLVAFYAICTNDIKLARRHLLDSGEMAANIQTMFVTK